MLALRQFRTKAQGLPDLLNYAALVDDGIVHCKDGTLLAGYYYHGPDIQSSTDAERNMIAERVNEALVKLGAGWSSWTDAARLPSNGYPPAEVSHFPDPVSRLIDAERRARFEAEGAHFESSYVVILAFTPPARRKTVLADIVYDDDEAVKPSVASRILLQFKKSLEDFEDSIASLIRLSRMRSYEVDDRFGDTHLRDELVNYLHFALTGDGMELNIPASGAYLDLVIGGVDLWPGDTPRLDEKFIAVVGIEGFPQESFPGILDTLDHLPIAYRWSSRMIYLDQQEAIHELKKYRRKWRQQIRGFFAQVFKTAGGTINEDAALMAAEAEASLTEARSGLVSFGYYTSVVVLMHPDRDVLLENARMVRREIRQKGFACRIEEVNTLEAWLGSLPGHPIPNVRRPMLHTEHLSHLLPLASVWTGREENPCPYYPPHSPPLLYAATTGATPMRLNLHVDDVGHTLIFGPTGAGKTMLLCTIAAQALRYAGAAIWSFDYKRGMLATAKATGGRHYDIAGEGDTPAFCPLAVLETADDLAWAEDWIAICFELQTGAAPSPDQRNAIHRAMLLLRSDKAPGARTLTHFVSEVQDETIRGALRYYTLGGAAGRLLDAERDSIEFGRWLVFEMEELLALSAQAALPVLLYLFRRFEKSLTGQPTFLLLDEAWVLLAHPAFRERIRQWLKVLRSKNCAVVMATQSLSDAVKSGILDVLIESCPTKIYLPNEEAETAGAPGAPGPRDFYQATGLNEVQISIIRHGVKKRQYYLVQPEGRRQFELGLGPIALTILGATGKEQIAEVNRLEAVHGDRWPFALLDQKGIDYAPLLG